ncbi:hypothetical protein LJR269_006651 [Duganella sp. LjRoot269]
MAVASAARADGDRGSGSDQVLASARAPAAPASSWYVPGRGAGQRRYRGACMAAAGDLVLQLKEAPARRRAGGAGGPAAGDGRGQRRAARAGGDRRSGGYQG